MLVDVVFSPILVILCHPCNPSQTTKRRVKNVAIFIRRSRWWQPSPRSFNIHVIPMMNLWWFGSPRRADEVGRCRIPIALVFQNSPVIPWVCRSLEPLKAEPQEVFGGFQSPTHNVFGGLGLSNEKNPGCLGFFLSGIMLLHLAGGFKHFLSLSLPGEMIPFD